MNWSEKDLSPKKKKVDFYKRSKKLICTSDVIRRISQRAESSDHEIDNYSGSKLQKSR